NERHTRNDRLSATRSATASVGCANNDAVIRRRITCGGRTFIQRERRYIMLGYAIGFLIVAIIAGILGFGVIAGTAALVAKILFVIFLILFVVSLFRGRRL